MMEDKENTRPREKKVVEIRCDDSEKLEKPNKEKKETMTKIVIRRLPPSLTKEQLEEQLQPLPEVDYLEFFSNDTSLYPHLFSRAYISFKNQDDIVLFRDRFDGYVFVDNRGQEYPAIVEFAPFQKIAKKRSKKKDAKAGTIDEDADYKKFLENYNRDDEKFTSTPETLLEEIEAKTKELGAKKTTPLLDFLKNKQRIREEKKEERRKRELERKRLRDEERRKWREEDRRKRKEAEKQKKGEKNVDREREESKEEPKIKLLRKPEKGDDVETESKAKDKPKKSEDRSSGMEFKKRPNGENREDRGRRKQDEDGRKEHRDWDMDRERERRQREKERITRRQEEERRKKRERYEAESSFRKRDEDTKKEKDRSWEKRKSENGAELGTHNEKAERSARDDRKEDSSKRDRVRNKDRPAIQLYQPGVRSRNRAGGVEAQAGERKAESQTKSTQEKGEE
ncbi:regulator of nonsense transcripts 3B [Paramormyrops kingsleyae]|uniref:UPF3B regulator of nonsense mediated mRNA decay n=1 Tax=Paramormyrops kingsleyae TaxID=1676925 RepID=A0A3B3Q2V4_9TELE|nr:regulator of nonsense transcripts 3B [Paramormyrops kingsleyae]